MCNNFTHFRLYTEYTVKNSIIKINELIKFAKFKSKKSLCITDKNNLFLSLKFYKECLKNKIKPIIGCNLVLKFKKFKYDTLLICKNNKGFLNLSKIISKSKLFFNNFIKFNWLKSSLKNNLIIILNLNSFYYKKINFKNCIKIINYLKKYNKNNFYLEINEKINNKNYNKIIFISNKFKIPLLAINPVSFLKKNDFLAYKIKTFIYNKKRKKISKNHYFYSFKKINKTFKEIKISIKNAIELSKRCNLFLKLNKIKLPFFKINKKLNKNTYFLKKLIKNLKFFNNNEKLKNYNFYKKRLLEEVKVIIKMDLTDYFLIVYDFVKWSKKKNIQVGPGRGSSAGSLVSYLLKITDLDPLKYNLIFERFLNKDRVTIPDFDIDFCQKERDKVIKYIKKKYGISYTSQIITFSRMASKVSIRDIGKFFKFNYDFINEVSKLIKINHNLNILELIKNNKSLYFKYKKNKKFKKLINFSIKLEGMIKTTSVHAGGVVISPNKIFNYSPFIIKNKVILNQYFKDDLEEIGILKFDFLGLITLTIIKHCIKNNKNIIIKKIKLNDLNCYKILTEGNTIGVFQLESEGIRNVLKMSKPKCFENIIALISLYRPGPIKFIKDFCLKKLNKKKIEYLDEKLKNILKETYGIIIYQEQIMQIVQITANYSLSEADNLRRVISKKKFLEMINEKNTFINRAINNNIEHDKALLIFNLIKEFANYGFNKSHAAAYSLLTFYTLWLKTYYIDDLMSSNMSYFFNDIEKLKIIIEDSKKNNIFIINIDINLSGKNFKKLKSKKYKKIRYGFKGLTGIGKNIINHIIKIRKKGLFKSFINFYKRINKRLVNYKCIEILITCGSFDSINPNRSNLIKKLILLFKIKVNKKLKFILLKKIYFKKNFFENLKLKY
ncbi:DNA polymerase III subunit alpha [Candidatus Nasuia deltocephalinicola]|uniref:DNA polymerase III subunit alpha n=1 Tax=Candidatus Nasuia deltocephalincola TaxID=1160784 RepID=A0A974WR20_9PROT|nr:DNA polymerase III subunit alpha [Candidatus Nasuia deltocephalinicola]